MVMLKKGIFYDFIMFLQMVQAQLVESGVFTAFGRLSLQAGCKQSIKLYLYLHMKAVQEDSTLV